MFQINQRISSTDFNRKGRVNDVISDNVYEIIWDDGDIEILSRNKIKHELISPSPWDQLAKNQFDDYMNFTISSILGKVRNLSANTISTLKASKTIFKPYQFIPLLKLLNSESKRIIVADEVGLGKTISAGHIVLELAARGELNSLLVVCLNSIQEKWIDELQNKFNVRLTKFETLKHFKAKLEDVKKHKDRIFGVINYDKFRQAKNLKYFKENAISFDMLIFDEAHVLRNVTNARKSLVYFTEVAKSVVMLTATPIMTSLENLYNLVKLLDEDNYSNYQIFQTAININKPFIKAYNQLNIGVSTQEIAEGLRNSQVVNIFKYGDIEDITKYSLSDILKDDSLFKNILYELENSKDLTVQKKVSLQEKLINLNSLNHFYTRTRKREVQTEGSIVRRNAKVPIIRMNESEEYIYQSVLQKVNDDIGGLQQKRKFSSSLFADNYSEEDYLKGVENLNFDDSKFSALIEIINMEQGKRVIVFAFFRKTLLYLKNRLSNLGYEVGVIYGGVEISERNGIIENFRSGNFQILLSSEVGSTGLDMQFCDRMVNYDLPWNPMVVEQRIGRIDRIGQQSEVINIFNLVYVGTIEEQIVNRLYNRIGLFKESLGNLDEILGNQELYIEGEIEKLYKQNLTKEERGERLDRIAAAVERNKLDLKRIDEGLKDSFANDLHFENEIKSIEKNNLYLTETDLIEFIERIIANKLTTLTFVKSKDKQPTYFINQPHEDIVFDFIEEYFDKENYELKEIYRKFKVKSRSKTIKCTFNQAFAFDNKNVEYISAYHPLINAISIFFQAERLDRNSIFRFSLNKRMVNNPEFKLKFNDGFYFLIKYEFEIKKLMNGKHSRFLLLKSLVIDLNGDSCIPFDTDYSQLFSSVCQQFKTGMPDNAFIEFDNDLTNEIKGKFSQVLLEEKNQLEENEKLKFVSELGRKTKQEILDLDKRIERLKTQIQEKKGIEPILISNLDDFEKKREKLIIENKQSTISVNSRLISLNFVYVHG